MRRPFFTGGTGYTPPALEEPVPITVEFAWSGNVDTDSATIMARCADSDAVELRYSTSSDLSGYSTVAGTEGADEMWTFALSSLSAATTYYYGFSGSAVEGKVKTFPSGAANFSIATASCAGNANGDYVGQGTSNAPTFDRIRDRDPAVFIHTGDRHYRDINSNNVTLFRTAYKDVMGRTRQRDLHLQVPVAYVWDDHDFGPNDSHGGSVSKPAAQQAYREHVPHWTLPDSDAIYQTFVIGRVRFILLDVRSERTQDSATDDSSKTMLGATQKQWLKDELLAATEPCIVLATICSWIGSLSYDWSSFGTEREELAEFFEANALTDRLLIICGDHHFTAADNGDHSQFADSVNPGPPVLIAAPMDCGFTTSTGTWTTGIKKVRKQQYGTIDFTDDGDEITAVIKGWALDANPGATEAELFSLSRSYTG